MTAQPIPAVVPDTPPRAVVIVTALVFIACLLGWAVALSRRKRARVVFVLGLGVLLSGQTLCGIFTDLAFAPFGSAFLNFVVFLLLTCLLVWAVSLWRHKAVGVLAPLGMFTATFGLGCWFQSFYTADIDLMMAYGVFAGVTFPTLGAIWSNKRQAPP